MQVMFIVEPIPGRDDDIALDTLRARWLRVRQLAFSDAVRPVGKITQIRVAELLDRSLEHGMAALSRLNAAKPGFLGGCELAQGERHVVGKGAHGAIADRMAVSAAV